MQNSGFQIGWASVDITPRLPAPLVGQFYQRTARAVRDPLTAVALAIDAETSGHSVIVSCDLIALDEGVLRRLRERLSARKDGPDPMHVMVCATHIHTGPYMSYDALSKFWGEEFQYQEPGDGTLEPGEYADFLVDRLYEAVCDAWQAREEGVVSSATDYAVTAHNRRSTYTDGTAVMYGSTSLPTFAGMEGPEDSGAELLYFKDRAGKLTGIAVNINCPAQVLEHKEFITADIWGEVRRLASGTYGDSMRILPLLGAAGDQSPRDMVRIPKDKGLGSSEMFHEAGARLNAERIMRAVARGLKKAEPLSDTTIRHHARLLKLPIRQVSREQAKAAEEECKRILQPNPMGKAQVPDLMKLSFARAIVNRYSLQQKTAALDVEVHTIRIGDVVLATNPFELFMEYGHRIKARSPARQTITVQLACGNGGYLPTMRAEAGGGYSAMVSNGYFGHEGGDALVEGTMEMIDELFSQ
jgi:hypothetical protein